MQVSTIFAIAGCFLGSVQSLVPYTRLYFFDILSQPRVEALISKGCCNPNARIQDQWKTSRTNICCDNGAIRGYKYQYDVGRNAVCITFNHHPRPQHQAGLSIHVRPPFIDQSQTVNSSPRSMSIDFLQSCLTTMLEICRH